MENEVSNLTEHQQRQLVAFANGDGMFDMRAIKALRRRGLVTDAPANLTELGRRVANELLEADAE